METFMFVRDLLATIGWAILILCFITEAIKSVLGLIGHVIMVKMRREKEKKKHEEMITAFEIKNFMDKRKEEARNIVEIMDIEELDWLEEIIEQRRNDIYGSEFVYDEEG